MLSEFLKGVVFSIFWSQVRPDIIVPTCCFSFFIQPISQWYLTIDSNLISDQSKGQHENSEFPTTYFLSV